MSDAPIERIVNRRALCEFIERCFDRRFSVEDVGVAGTTPAVALDFCEVAPAVGEIIWHQPLPRLPIERTSYF